MALAVLACGPAAQTITPVDGLRVEREHFGEAIVVPRPGVVTVLDFWSTTCAPCIEAMPGLEQLWQRQDQGAVLFVGVALDEREGPVRDALDEQVRVSFPMVFDGGSRLLAETFAVGETLPVVVVVDGSGVVRYRKVGYDDSLAELEAAIAAAAGGE